MLSVSARTKVKLGQGCHCPLIVQKKKLPPHTWASFPFKFLFLSHLRKGTFSCDLVVFVWEIPTSDQSLKALTVPWLCSVALNQPYNICKWLASHNPELYLALSTVATLPQLSWGFHRLEAVVFSDLEFGCQSKMLVSPDESGKRQEMYNVSGKVHPGVGCHTDLSSHGQRTDVWDIFILILLLVCWIDLTPTILTLCLRI